MNFTTLLALARTRNLSQSYLELDFALFGNETKYFCRLLQIILPFNKMIEEIKINPTTTSASFQDAHHEIFKTKSLIGKAKHVSKISAIISFRIALILMTAGVSELFYESKKIDRRSSYDNAAFNILRILKGIRDARQIITINLSSLNVHDSAFVEFMKELAKGKYPAQLTINLSYNHIQDEGVIWMTKALRFGKFKKPLNIDLQYNEISEPAIVLLCRYLAKVPNIDINLCGNLYSEIGQAAIDRANLIKKSKPILACLTMQQVNRVSSLPSLPQEILNEIYQYIYPQMSNTSDNDRRLFINKIESIDNQLIAKRQQTLQSHTFFSQPLKRKTDGNTEENTKGYKKSY